MTRAELIRKIARHNGVPDYEAKYFFGTFLQKASGILQTEQAVKVNGFGYFQKRQAVFKASHLGDKQALQSDVILFSPEDETADSLVFNIPSIYSEKSNVIDSYFSLSIGKPVIPLFGVNSGEVFLQPAGAELKKLIESKAEKLLTESTTEINYGIYRIIVLNIRIHAGEKLKVRLGIKPVLKIIAVVQSNFCARIIWYEIIGGISNVIQFSGSIKHTIWTGMKKKVGKKCKAFSTRGS